MLTESYTMKYPIVRPVLPSSSGYFSRLEQVFASRWLTNSGPMQQELEARLADYLGVKYLLLVSNGTLALQVAYKALGLGPQVLTTPFSFAATASSLVWQQHQCQFVDIDRHSFNIDPNAITEQQWQQADGLVATHVFGNPCAVESLAAKAQQTKTKLIYDAAHAFGCQYQGQSLLNYGDASTLSLHATKIFHTVEGGAIVFKHEQDWLTAKQLINFGFDGQQYPELVGINSKMSEVHAAMGLALFEQIETIQQQRCQSVADYQHHLSGVVEFQHWCSHSHNNGAYMPILLADEGQLLRVMAHLQHKGIQTRRYFYPSLSQVPCYGRQGDTPIANRISQRVLCLPLYYGLERQDIRVITQAVKEALRA